MLMKSTNHTCVLHNTKIIDNKFQKIIEFHTRNSHRVCTVSYQKKTLNTKKCIPLIKNNNKYPSPPPFWYPSLNNNPSTRWRNTSEETNPGGARLHCHIGALLLCSLFSRTLSRMPAKSLVNLNSTLIDVRKITRTHLQISLVRRDKGRGKGWGTEGAWERSTGPRNWPLYGHFPQSPICAQRSHCFSCDIT